MPSPDLAVESWELSMRQGRPRCITLSRAEAQSFKDTRPDRCGNIVWFRWRKPVFLVKRGIIHFCPKHKGKCSNVPWGGWGHKEAGNHPPPDLLGTGLNRDPTHTCVLTVELFEGTDEVRLVSKELLSQDFESWALSSSNAVNSKIAIRKTVTWHIRGKMCVQNSAENSRNFTTNLS